MGIGEEERGGRKGVDVFTPRDMKKKTRKLLFINTEVTIYKYGSYYLKTRIFYRTILMPLASFPTCHLFLFACPESTYTPLYFPVDVCGSGTETGSGRGQGHTGKSSIPVSEHLTNSAQGSLQIKTVNGTEQRGSRVMIVDLGRTIETQARGRGRYLALGNVESVNVWSQRIGWCK